MYISHNSQYQVFITFLDNVVVNVKNSVECWYMSVGNLITHIDVSFILGFLKWFSEGDTKSLYAIKLVPQKDLGSIVHLGIIY